MTDKRPKPGEQWDAELSEGERRQIERELRGAHEFDGRPSLECEDPLLDKLFEVHGKERRAWLEKQAEAQKRKGG